MLTHFRKPVSLSLVSIDLPVRSLVETAATVYQKDKEQFHLLLHEPGVLDQDLDILSPNPSGQRDSKPRLLWLEISPYRAVMTMQGNGQYSYRHLWQKGMYGLSRYYLQHNSVGIPQQFRLRNFTRDLQMTGHPFPTDLRLEYELWCQTVQLGRYVLSLEVHH
ncbi:MAG: hypothetical protein HC825_02595 [Oscillatoriales cyanobacterium RM1_1_9]|nr:hypothetical protein [Oscillatoriales cyanobacterium SM2_3_0]NJO46472.1 hypothetical protein [Oscillatoriales cyanobacterium RM2_1_1]NJO70880.1 hypothetical protein [Oscillatoriales cyanobacterium RM1_1_9]